MLLIVKELSGNAQDPWIIMHKIDSPTKMRYVGNRVAACNASDPTAIPKSIAEFVKRPGAPPSFSLTNTLVFRFVKHCCSPVMV